MFFSNLDKVYDKYNFQCQDIYNVDETPSMIIARKDVKQVGAVTSAERGSLVTMAVAVSASGNSILPFIAFPRKKYRDYFITSGPEGSSGSANKSGWVTGNDFVFMQHFIKHTRVTKDRPVLLLPDNYQSRLAIKVLDLAKENGVVLLSFPPHTSHKLQSLDRSVYGPFKKFVNSASDACLRSNRGRIMTIYDILSIVNHSLPNALTPKNIKSGFLVTGIWPFNRDIFTDDDFLPCAVTDRPLQDSQNLTRTSECHTSDPYADISNQPSASGLKTGPSASQRNGRHVSPVEIRPFPKAEASKERQKRKPRVSAVLTDIPVKAALEAEVEARSRPVKR
jgi:hypothetical protein